MDLSLVITTDNIAAARPPRLEAFDREPNHGFRVVAASGSPTDDNAALMTRQMAGYRLKGSDTDGADNGLARAREVRRAVRSAVNR